MGLGRVKTFSCKRSEPEEVTREKLLMKRRAFLTLLGGAAAKHAA